MTRRCKFCGSELVKPDGSPRDPRAEHCDDKCRRDDWGERTGYDRQTRQRRLQVRSNGYPALPGQRPTACIAYAFLRARGNHGATTAELVEVAGIKFASRLSDLRAAGCVIESQQLRLGRWRYWLRHDAFAEIPLPDDARRLAAVPSDQRVIDLTLPIDQAA